MDCRRPFNSSTVGPTYIHFVYIHWNFVYPYPRENSQSIYFIPVRQFCPFLQVFNRFKTVTIFTSYLKLYKSRQ